MYCTIYCTLYIVYFNIHDRGRFVVDGKFVLSEELQKVIGPDQELYNVIQVSRPNFNWAAAARAAAPAKFPAVQSAESGTNNGGRGFVERT